MQHFRFLGGQDCPDWLLAQISEFSKLSSVKFRGLCQLSIDFLLNKEVADESVERFVSEHIDNASVRRFLYSLSFMMKNTASYNCASEDFETECTHLGLPPEHSKMLARVYTGNVDVLKKYVRDSIPKESPLESVSVIENESNVSLNYTKDGEATTCRLTSGQLASLRKDMALVRDIMEKKFKE